ncbi:hypothetical protein SAMCFNEI73_Ch0218 [Sinorhizobium americanum]|uniref:Uncharacterized protein n=1 Tax=Sinorhizobium americanum TaxID=194963 RepID=A0A1L3LHG1_9HYPH|nr:hypothetical protein SAMCFNEI73_Ch0218 [Sinorhizobium americanum]
MPEGGQRRYAVRHLVSLSFADDAGCGSFINLEMRHASRLNLPLDGLCLLCRPGLPQALQFPAMQRI